MKSTIINEMGFVNAMACIISSDEIFQPFAKSCLGLSSTSEGTDGVWYLSWPRHSTAPRASCARTLLYGASQGHADLGHAGSSCLTNLSQMPQRSQTMAIPAGRKCLGVSEPLPVLWKVSGVGLKARASMCSSWAVMQQLKKNEALLCWAFEHQAAQPPSSG